jgi:hypothetical protein
MRWVKACLLTTGFSGPGVFLDEAVETAIMLAELPIRRVTRLEDFSQVIHQVLCNIASNESCEALF